MVLLVLLTGCGVTALDVFETCELDLDLDRETAAPGAVVTATGGPQFARFDTVVRVNGIAARVLDVTRSTGCDVCDTCRVEEQCEACGFCPACDDVCEAPAPVDTADPGAPPPSGCLETLAFEVPPLTGGSADVVVVNRFGTSPALPLTILEGDTSDTGDTHDTGTTPTIPTGDTGITTTSTGDTSTTPMPTGDTGATIAPTGDTADTAAPDTADTSTAPADTADTADTGI